MTNSSAECIDNRYVYKSICITTKGEEVPAADLLISTAGIKTCIKKIRLEEVGIVVDKNKILVNTKH